MNMNLCILGGNLTRDPELRYTPNGKGVAEFGIAVNRVWTSEAGEKKEDVSFFDIQAWGRTAEVISQYFKKGNPILVTCRAKLEQWDDKNDGRKRSKIKFIVDSFQFCGKTDGGSGGGEERPPARRTQTATAPVGGGADEGQPAEDDVPF